MNESCNNFKNKEASIKNLENHVGQISKKKSERPSGMFPSDTEFNPREQCNMISLRSGKNLSVPGKIEVVSEREKIREEEREKVRAEEKEMIREEIRKEERENSKGD